MTSIWSHSFTIPLIILKERDESILVRLFKKNLFLINLRFQIVHEVLMLAVIFKCVVHLNYFDFQILRKDMHSCNCRMLTIKFAFCNSFCLKQLYQSYASLNRYLNINDEQLHKHRIF